MNCKESEMHFPDYIDGVLDDKTRMLVEEHLASCTNCQKELSELKTVLASFHASPMHKPESRLRTNFEQMLEEEKRKAVDKKPKQFFFDARISWSIAASVMLFVAGYWLGQQNNANSSAPSKELAELRQEIKDTKTMMMISLLQNPSASDRIRAVQYSYQFEQADSLMLESLINTMDNDANINVRLAATQALFRFSSNDQVRYHFIRSLRQQSDPMMRIMLIDMLISMRENKAVGEMAKLLQDKNVEDVVKQKLKEGIGTLM